jgi:hypothetical protein
VSAGSTTRQKWQSSSGLEYMEYAADWNKYGRGTGPIRNKLIVEHSDAMIAFWDGISDGTHSSIRHAEIRNDYSCKIVKYFKKVNHHHSARAFHPHSQTVHLGHMPWILFTPSFSQLHTVTMGKVHRTTRFTEAHRYKRSRLAGIPNFEKRDQCAKHVPRDFVEDILELRLINALVLLKTGKGCLDLSNLH